MQNNSRRATAYARTRRLSYGGVCDCSSAMRRRLLTLISSAWAMFHTVFRLGAFLPLSTMARWLRAMPALPESTSWERPRCLRSLRLTRERLPLDRVRDERIAVAVAADP